MRIATLTGGGDAPGLNAAVRAVARAALNRGWEVVGSRQGWLGLLNMDTVPVTRDTVKGILPQGGTILGTSRTNPFTREDGSSPVLENMKRLGIDALIPIGGNGTLGAANRLSKEGVPLVGVPKTIDNDISGTDYCIGFDTAVTEVARSLDRLHSTAEAHNRVMIVEVMGRHEGWVAVLGGMAGGADVILAPEIPFTLEDVCNRLRRRHEEFGRDFSIVVVAESAIPTELIGQITPDLLEHSGLGGIGHRLAPEIEKRTGYDTRVTVLGHLQRGGPPTAFDRILATRLGVAAVEEVAEGNFGKMVAMKGNRIVTVPLEEAVSATHSLDTSLYEMSLLFF